MRKQPTFRDATTGFLDFLKVVRLVFWSGVVGPARSRFALKSSTCEQVYWFPREMTSEKREQKFHHDNASLPRSAADWLKSALVSPTSFRGETSGDVSKCQLFS